MIRPILVASFNPGKARELRHLLAGTGIAAVTLPDCGIDEPFEEGGATYEENARGKALHYARSAGRVTVADDSGIEVDALGGRPGVLSARYGGDGLGDADRCRLLLRELAGVPDDRRTARYVAVAAVARPDGAVRLFRATCEGRIAGAMQGEGGFGYDPVFFFPAFGATFGQVEEARKHEVSHRGKALRSLVEFLSGEQGRTFLEGEGGPPATA